MNAREKMKAWSVSVQVCVCLCVANVLCFHALASTDDNAQVLDAARRRIDAGQYQVARELLRPYLEAPSPKSDEVEYLAALLSFAEPDPDTAEATVRSFVKRYPYSEFAPISLYRLAQFFQMDAKDPARSIRIYSDYFMAYPDHRMADKARLGYISALLDAGRYDRAGIVIKQAEAIHEYAGEEKNSLERFKEIVAQNTSPKRAPAATWTDNPPRANPSAPSAAVSNVNNVNTRPPLPALPPPLSVVAPAPAPATVQSAWQLVPSSSTDRPKIARARPIAVREDTGAKNRGVFVPPRAITIEPYILVYFKKADIDEVLKSYSRELGLTLKKDVNVQAKITMTPKPRLLNRTQALSLLSSVLELQGYTMVGAGDTFAILPAAEPVMPGTQFVTFGAGVSDEVPAIAPPTADFSSATTAVVVPEEDVAALSASAPSAASVPPASSTAPAGTPAKQVAGEWIKIHALSHANAENMERFLHALIERGVDSGISATVPVRAAVIRADRMSNSVVVAGPPDVQDAFESLIEKLDYEGFSEFQIQVVPLRFARAAELADKFRNIIDAENRTQRDSTVLPILVQSDNRMNSLLISSSSQRLMKTFTDLAAQLDQPVLSPQLKQIRSLSDIHLSAAP